MLVVDVRVAVEMDLNPHSQNRCPTRQSTGRCAIKPRSAGDFNVEAVEKPIFHPEWS